jgi:hypothetical protein
MPRKDDGSRQWWTTMLRDPRWWVPLIVLVGGLIVLRWIG